MSITDNIEIYTIAEFYGEGNIFMKAIVRKVNYKRGWVVFESQDYDFGWFEILDKIDLEEGDEMTGVFNELGGTTIIKKSTGEKMEVFVEDYGMSYKKAMEIIFR